MRTVLFLCAAARGSWSETLEGASRYAREHNWLLIDVPQPIENDILRDVLKQFNPSGIMIDSPYLRMPPITRIRPLIPAVVHNPNSVRTSLPIIKHDQSVIAELAARELLTIGMRHFAYIEYPQREFWSTERGKAFCERIRSTGGTCRVYRDNAHAVKGSFTAFHDKALQKFLTKLPKPVGIFAANDQIASRVIANATMAGFSVPNDIAIIGADNQALYCERSTPGITSIPTEFERGGYLFAELLDRLMTDPSSVPPISYYAPSHIVRRGSTLRTATNDDTITKALEHIRRNFSSCEIRLETVAKEMGLPRCEATRRFREATGRTILDEIQERRLEKMKKLLTETDTNISAVVNFCGYASEGFPKRMFHAKTGMTMRQYRTASRETLPL